MKHQLATTKKHYLGRRAFLLFFLRHIKGPLFLFILAAVVWYAERWLPPQGVALIWVDFAARVALLTALFYLLAVLILTYMTYRVHTYWFTDEAFMMTSGLITRNEVAALYHQIQNVNINRSPGDRLLGVSQMVIFMTGSGQESDRARIVLPAIGKSKAKLIQHELLSRARRHIAPHAPGGTDDDDD